MVCQHNRYILHYPEGGIVKAIPGSMGIICSETYDDALYFIKCIQEKRAGTWCSDIIKVEGIGRGKKPMFMSRHYDEWTIDTISKRIKKMGWNKALKDPYFYVNSYVDDGIPLFKPWPGTICYDSVKVLT